ALFRCEESAQHPARVHRGNQPIPPDPARDLRHHAACGRASESVMRRAKALLIFGAGMAVALTPPGADVARPPAVPRYEHIFLIIEENKSYTEIVGEQSIA